jgi:hypothetical protein
MVPNLFLTINKNYLMKAVKISIAVIGVLLLVSCHKKNVDNQFTLKPPIPGLEVKFTDFSIDNSLGDTIFLPDGSYLLIPPKCFADSKGKTVMGKVDLKYRQFNDAVDIYLSGIPMRIQSAGQSSNLQTTGMFELRATQGSETLKFAKGKEVGVFINTKTADINYNFFRFNEKSGNWEFMDYPECQNTEESLIRALRNKISGSLDTSDNYFIYNFDVLFDISKMSYEPLKQKVKKYNINIYNIPAQGELIWNNNYYLTCEMLWKDLDNKSFPKWLNNSDWYYFWFHTVDKHQVLSKESGNVYNLLFSYEGKKFVKRAEAIIPLKYLMQLEPDAWKANISSKISEIIANTKIDVKEEAYKSFTINEVGIYNFDRLYKQKEWYFVRPSFTLENSSTPLSKDILMITEDNTSCFVLDGLDSIKFNPDVNPRIFALLPDNKIAVYPLENLKKEEVLALKNQNNPHYNFKLIDAGTVKNSVQLREMLGFSSKK